MALLVYILTPLAAVVVVLTRLRLRRGGGAARTRVGPGLVGVHTVAGVAALVLWVWFLVAGDETGSHDLTGILALACWWVTVFAGLGLLVRWLPARGRHAHQAAEDRWSAGPWLSWLAHGGLVVGVLVFTLAYLTAAV
jgi:hypothetical protein